MSYKWKPSKSKIREFASKMNEIDEFCQLNRISQSATNDSYYFELNGKKYRVSNHSPESSLYHDGRDDDVVYIHASKSRVIEIYNNLKSGMVLNGKGEIK